jgi:hypothetical protein
VGVPPSNGVLFGFTPDVPDGWDVAKTVSTLKSAGANAFRFNFIWLYAEPNRGSDNAPYWNSIRSLVTAVSGAGITPILRLHSAPAWARTCRPNCDGNLWYPALA